VDIDIVVGLASGIIPAIFAALPISRHWVILHVLYANIHGKNHFFGESYGIMFKIITQAI